MKKIYLHSLTTLVLFFVFSLALFILPSSYAQAPSDGEKVYTKIEERIKKTKNRLQYLYKYASWNDENTSKYYQDTQTVFNRMLSIGEICINFKDPAKVTECDTQTKRLYDAAKAGYRLTKYYSIMSGKTSTCVNANLGVKPIREGTPVEPTKTSFGNKPQSLFLCSGEDNAPGNVKLRWRVEATDGGMIKVKEDFRIDPQMPQNIDNVRNAEKLIWEVLNETI